MSFEKKMKKRGNDKLNQFAKNPYHQENKPESIPVRKRFPLWATIAIPSVAVATLMIVLMPAYLPMITGAGANAAAKNDNDPIDNKGSNKNYSGNETAAVDNSNPHAPAQETSITPVWDDKTIVQQYPEFTYQDIKYTVNDLVSVKAIEEQYINEKINDIVVSGFDSITNQNHETNASLYSIKNIDLDVSLAIKFANTENYFAYENNGLIFADMGELIDKLSFNDTFICHEIGIHEYPGDGSGKQSTFYNNVTTKDVSDVLFTDRTIKGIKDGHETRGENTNNCDYIYISFKIPCLGIDDAIFRLSAGGELYFSYADNYCFFDVNETMYASVKEVIQTKGTLVTR